METCKNQAANFVPASLQDCYNSPVALSLAVCYDFKQFKFVL